MHPGMMNGQYPDAQSQEMPAGFDESMAKADQFESEQVSNTPVTDQMREGLKNLTPQELMIIDQAITPEVGVLLSKAFGPEVAQLFKQFYENDDQQDYQQPTLPEPANNNPMSNITAGGSY